MSFITTRHARTFLRTGAKRHVSILIATSIFLSFLLIFTSSCTKNTSQNAKVPSIGVLIPGVRAGSPVYDMLARGVTKAVEEYNTGKSDGEKVLLNIVEAGTNQAEWGSKLTGLAASGAYTLIISANSSIPQLAEPITKQFVNQKFLILDAFYGDNENIATVNYNQREQSFLTGYASALATIANKEEFALANSAKKIALIAAQEYPVMNEIILPGFIEGAKAVDSEVEVLFRVVGNWYDASKSADIAKLLFAEGVDVILPICGGANQGVIAQAKELGFYVAWFDSNGFANAPGHVISSTLIDQETMAYQMTMRYLQDGLNFGSAETVSAKDGFIKLVTDDAIYQETMSASFKSKMDAIYNDIKNGTLSLPQKRL